MAQTKKNSAKNFALFMMMLTVGCAGTAWYLHNEADTSVTILRKTQEGVIKQAMKIKTYHRPSLNNYFDLIANEVVKKPTPQEKEETKGKLDKVCQTAGIEKKFLSNYYPADLTARRDQEYAEAKVVCTLNEVTRTQYEYVLAEAHRLFNNYATVSNLNIALINAKQDFTNAVDEDSLLWKVTFQVVWYEKTQRS
ncbi:MAG: hypothetical protein HUU29_10410 [Planctomycetaceae bacterium]|nr:hypothetical protein [Planctomycetaceae bacterium]